MQHRLLTYTKTVFSRLLQVPERELVKRAVKGDSEAFGKLYLKYLDALYRYVYYRVEHDAHTAEDLVDIAFTKAYEHIGRFDTAKGTFQAWLYQICRNCVLDHFRALKHVHPLDHPTVLAQPDPNPEPEELAMRGLEYKRVMGALTHLSAGQREVITLKFINGLSNKEIATITGKKEDAIRAIQHRSLESIRAILDTNHI